MKLSVNSDWSYRGLRTMVLENRLLRVIILPEAGAKIWLITYKPFDTGTPRKVLSRETAWTP